jgi:RND family efflux transporter MFP subunit
MQTKQTALAVVIGLGLLLASALQAARLGGAQPAPASPTARTEPREVAAEGRVVAYPGAEILVGAERSGRLERLLVEEGQAVKKGALVAEFETDELRASLLEAKTRIAESEAEVRLAESNRARKQRLIDQEIVSTHDFDEAVRDLDIARARLETNRASVARIEAQLVKSRILAPISGTVVLRHVDAGETLETGAHVVTIADLGRLRIEGEADEADASGLRLGTEVSIRSDGYPGQSWKGRVEEIPESVTIRRLKPQDPARPTDTRVLSVKVAFAEPTPLKLGTTVDLRIAR